MKLGRPIIRSFQNGGTANPWSPGSEYFDPAMFTELQGYAQDPAALASYLESEFGLQNASDYTEFFMEYDPTKQQQLQTSYGEAMDVAGQTARNTAGAAFDEARKAASMGGGFGGVGRSLDTALGRTFSEQEQAQERAQQSYYGGVYDEQQAYVDDFLRMVGQLGDMGAQFCQGGEVWSESENSCVPATVLDDEEED